MNYSNEETNWFSQMLLNFKDKNYGSEGNLSVYLTFNTNDFKFFSPPAFSIVIKNNITKRVNINYSNAIDLFETIEEIFKTASVNGAGLQIDRRYSKNEKLYLSFFKKDEERLVKIILQSSETDLVSIVIPLKPQFISIIKCLKYYIENYFTLCSNMLLKTVDTKYYKIFETVPGIIKTLPSQIVSDIPRPPSNVPAQHPVSSIPADLNFSYSQVEEPKIDATTVQEAKKSEDLMNDFSNFLGKDMNNVKVDLIETPYTEPKKEIDIESVFISKLLKNKIENLEAILNDIKSDSAPILSLADKIKQAVNGSDEKFTMFPGISESDLKSIVYLSTLNFREGELNNLKNNKPIPSQASIARYNPTVFPEKNMNIAYDLFIVTIFLRIYRRWMESKTTDTAVCAANFQFQMRCFTDPFVFSFIDKIDKDKFKSMISTRFVNYQQQGFFNKYQELLKHFNLDEITVKDINNDVELVIEKVIGKMGYTEDLHSQLEKEGKCKLPAKNNFTLEQITKELIPVEIELMFGKKAEEFKSDTVPLDVYKLLIESKDSRKLGNEIKSNLYKLVSDYKDDVPPEYIETLLDLINKTGYEKFDIFTDKVPLNTCSEKIVKALYVWDPKTDSKMKTNYKYFCQRIDDELMTKDLILSKPVEPSKDSSWDSIDFSNM